LLAEGKLRSITFATFQQLTGLELEGEGGGLRRIYPPSSAGSIILALRVALQNAIFDEYLGLIEARLKRLGRLGRSTSASRPSAPSELPFSIER
jgi:hypothetical protein